MTGCVLAGDIGGTKTNLALYASAGSDRLSLVREASFHSRDYPNLDAIVAEFLAGPRERIAAAAFGVAGPIVDGVVEVTNLPWRIEAQALGRVIGCPSVRLMNDLESTAYGALFVDGSELLTLNAGEARAGNRAVIAAGTGLGAAFLIWDGSRYHTSASEFGHTDFGPRDEREDGLVRFLRARYGRVSGERVLSGPGLHHVFTYLVDGLHRPLDQALRARIGAADDPSALIGDAGVAGTCATCAEAVDMFVSIYGAQAGNLALAALSIGGLYVGGGIVTKLLPRFAAGGFLAAFVDKAPHRELLERMPVHVLRNPKTALIGSAHAAAEMLTAH